MNIEIATIQWAGKKQLLQYRCLFSDLLFLFAESARHEVVLSPDGTGNKIGKLIFSPVLFSCNVSKVQLRTDAPPCHKYYWYSCSWPWVCVEIAGDPWSQTPERHPGCNGCLDRQYVIIGGCCLLQPLSSDTGRVRQHCTVTQLGQ